MYILLILAVFFDVRTFRIPNRLILAGYVAGSLYRFFHPAGQFWIYYPASAVGLFFFLIPFYKIRAFGGGDLKLLSVCALFTGWEKAVSVVLYTFLIGGIISVFFLVYHLKFSKEFNNKKFRHVIHFSIPILGGVICESIWGGFL
nr:prepilin peptidase [Lachnospiraceae bacterium]